jgi:A/G-specific adenine glycosylase
MTISPKSSGQTKAIGNVAARVLAWYDRNARTLPWRYPPGERADPYRVWLSEIMLQQTTVAAVRAYFERFTTLWPTVADLAASPVDDVTAAWAGLGYYSRARNLHAAARMVVNRFGGAFPADEAELRELPGVGPYTAAAIASIAFGLKATPLDGNIERVMCRLHAVETPLPAVKPQLKALAESHTPDTRAGDYAQGLMDLGATICTPKSPVCALCPLNADCHAFALGIAADLPRRAAKADRPHRVGAAFVLVSTDGNILLRRREAKGLLGGMLEVPGTTWAAEPPSAPFDHAPAALDWVLSQTQAQHVFTHFSLSLDVYAAETADERISNGLWTPLETARETLPTVMRKVVAAALDQNRPARGNNGRRGRG